MKRQFFAVLLAGIFLLLTGCGAEKAVPPVSLPETETLPALSAPAVVTEGQPPEEDYDLPGEVMSLVQWHERAAPMALLAQTGEAALYGFSGDEDRILLRWGQTLSEFDWPYQTPRAVMPRLWQMDADGDGDEELVAICYVGSGTGVSIDQLHIVEKNEDDTLTDFCFPQTLWQEDLSERLSVFVTEDRTFAVLGKELVEISENLGDLDFSTITGIGTGDTSYFDVSPKEGLFFYGTARLTAESYAFGWLVADLSAQVSYENGTFTLSRFHLDSLE